jgi:hypothetical protein
MAFHGSAYFFLLFDANLSLRNVDLGGFTLIFLETHTKTE